MTRLKLVLIFVGGVMCWLGFNEFTVGEGASPEPQPVELDSGRGVRCRAVVDWVPTAGLDPGEYELRVLPSGPTVRDEVANAALWFGVISGLVS